MQGFDTSHPQLTNGWISSGASFVTADPEAGSEDGIGIRLFRPSRLDEEDGFLKGLYCCRHMTGGENVDTPSDGAQPYGKSLTA